MPVEENSFLRSAPFLTAGSGAYGANVISGAQTYPGCALYSASNCQNRPPQIFGIGRLGVKQTAAPNRKEVPTGRGASPCRPAKARRAAERTPPAETTHWTASLMAKAVGISASSVQRIWRAHGLQPHRVQKFKLCNDPKFIDKLRDVVGLYVDPAAHAIVLSADEKSQIQALDRTQPGLPMKKGRDGTMTHD